MSVAEPLTPGGLKQGCWKRKGSEEEEDASNSNSKKAKYSWYVTLESESPQPSSSDEDESIYSIQEQETEYVRDTSDTSTSTWMTSDDDAIEFQPVTLSVDANPFIDCLSSSDPELQISHRFVGYVGAIAAAAGLCDSDVDLADDSDDSVTSKDSEISHADYWTCVQCNNKNNKPLFRYCERCYQVRKQFLPPRPKGKKRRKEVKKRWSRRGRANGGGGDLLASQDSGVGSSLGSQSTTSFDLKNEVLSPQPCSSSQSDSLVEKWPQPCSSSQSENLSEKWSQASKEASGNLDSELELAHESQESQASIATTMSISNLCSDSSDDAEAAGTEKFGEPTLKVDPRTDEENKLCLFCTVGPKNGILVHGRDSHICCCYRCAIRVWKTTKHCPICKRKVTDVIKAYFA